MMMIREPEQFEVIVTNNLFGDIITDLGAMLQGGLGLAASGNINPAGVCMFEPVHGSAPDMAGKDVANPLAMLGATAEALRWLGRRHGDERLVRGARAIDEAIAAIVARGQPLTGDLVGPDRAAPRSVVAAAVTAEALARLS